MKSKNEKLLKEFTEYCKQNPSQRFYQALRNWAGYAFIYGSQQEPNDVPPTMKDTFYFENKNQ